MKNISFLVVFLILLQSCNVYHSPTSVEAAVAADKKAKVYTTNKREYKFRRLENKNDRLVGITKPGSSSADKLTGMPSEMVGKYLEIDLSSLDIEKIRLRNQTGSTLLTVAIIAGSFILVGLISVLSAFAAM